MSEPVKFYDAITPKKRLEGQIKAAESRIALNREKQMFIEKYFVRMVQVGKDILSLGDVVKDEDVERYLKIYIDAQIIPLIKNPEEKRIVIEALDNNLTNLENYLQAMYGEFSKQNEISTPKPLEHEETISTNIVGENIEDKSDNVLPLTKSSVKRKLNHIGELVYFYPNELIQMKKNFIVMDLETKYATLIELGEKLSSLFNKIEDVLGNMVEIGIKPEEEDIYRILLNGLHKLMIRSYHLIYNSDSLEFDAEVASIEENISSLNENLVNFLLQDVKKM